MTFVKPPLLLLVDDEQGVRESLKMVFGKVVSLARSGFAPTPHCHKSEMRFPMSSYWM